MAEANPDKKKKKKNKDDTNEAPLAVVDVHVSVHNWAYAATTESSFEGLHWLTSNEYKLVWTFIFLAYRM